MRIAVPSAGLAFSVVQVSAVGYAARQRVLAEASRAELTGCSSYCDVLANVWAALVPVFQAQQDEPDLHLIVLRSPDIEALSFADGTLVISENFIERQGLDEAQIAFILAHEASHVLLQHERQTLTSMLTLMPSKVARSPEDIYAEMEYNYFLESASLSIVFQQVELEADEIGMQLAAMAGFAPQLQLKFMEQRASEPAEANLFATHPPAAERLLRLREQVPLAIRLFQFGKERM
jgi:Zn-dependent protease with chaperone function